MTGKGVSYCGTCDGAFFRDVPVAVIGGGDTALEEAMFLTRFASTVYLVHRRDEFRAVKYLQEKVLAEPKIEPVMDSVAESIDGDGDKVTGVTIKNVKSGEKSTLEVEGAFIFVGVLPNSDYLKGSVPLNEKGFIETDGNMMTSIPGVFAAGDIRAKVLRQISTAVGEGAQAAFMADHHLG
jgi:thioredoxin reductase (NADPH)